MNIVVVIFKTGHLQIRFAPGNHKVIAGTESRKCDAFHRAKLRHGGFAVLSPVDPFYSLAY